MSYVLVGPYPFDTNAVTASGRSALAHVGGALRQGKGDMLLAEPATAEAPGLYVVLAAEDVDGRATNGRIAGFWIVFGLSYLDDGTVGPPDRDPPYADGLLEAATEEVWWKNLKVTVDRKGTWRPVVVLEWPSQMASRSLVAPPGVVREEEDDTPTEAVEAEAWLDPIQPETGATPAEVEEEEHRADPFAEVPLRRSLVTVVRGTLTYDRSLHRGSTMLVPPRSFAPLDGPMVVALSNWVDASMQLTVREATSEDLVPPAHETGRPLELYNGRVGFPLHGWLTRGLDAWPVRPKEVRPGVLTDRVVQTKWIGQVIRGTVSMVTVLAMVLALAITVRIAAEPRPEATAVAPPPAAQPVMSVCSADHQQFVEEFRCQLTRFAASSGDFVDDPWCRDPGSTEIFDDEDGDLQPAVCGLLDRGLDAWEGNRVESDALYNFGELAAAQACFNVLGHPYTYAQPKGYATGDRLVPDPDKFLRDESLEIRELSQLVEELTDACDVYRERTEHLVEGAVFAAHVGAPMAEDWQTESEPAALRRLAKGYAVEGMTPDQQRCFERGMTDGLAGSEYAGLCGPIDRQDQRFDALKIWGQLGGVPQLDDDKPPEQLVGSYVSARFGLGGNVSKPKSSSQVWQCHLMLSELVPPSVPPRVDTLWDLSVPVPSSYVATGDSVRSQMLLDSALRSFEMGADAGTCWNLIDRRMRSYEPVHPLLAELDPEGWPSAEQQLCGQVCATVYRVRDHQRREDWVTPIADLGECVTTREPSERPDMGRGAIDRLRLPWNGAQRVGWQKPTVAQICSFNLVAQNYMPSEEDSYIVGGRAPVQWAGETASGSRIAAGPEGLATQAIVGMHRYGTGSGWSVGRCGHVATQCFTSMMTKVMGDKDNERYEWLDRWNYEVEKAATSNARDLAREQPWCQPLQPYLSSEREMAQFDAPCRQGVETARRNAEWALRLFASGFAGPAGQ